MALDIMPHEKRIEIRWRDCDAYGHVNNAVYATYLEECRDEWLERVLERTGDIWDFVLARVAIDFRRELRQEQDTVLARCRLERIGTSSVTTREEILMATGELSAEAEAVLVARDPQTGASRPLRPDERKAFERASILGEAMAEDDPPAIETLSKPTMDDQRALGHAERGDESDHYQLGSSC